MAALTFVLGLASQTLVALLLVGVGVLLAGISLWMSGRLRVKRRQTQALMAAHQALLEHQLAELQAMREAGQQSSARPAQSEEGLPEAKDQAPDEI